MLRNIKNSSLRASGQTFVHFFPNKEVGCICFYRRILIFKHLNLKNKQIFLILARMNFEENLLYIFAYFASKKQLSSLNAFYFDIWQVFPNLLLRVLNNCYVTLLEVIENFWRLSRTGRRSRYCVRIAKNHCQSHLTMLKTRNAHVLKWRKSTEANFCLCKFLWI